MSLARRCTDAFYSFVRSHGLHCFDSGRVALSDHSGHGIQARVAGSKNKPYRVIVEWNTGQAGVVAVSCTCSYFGKGTPCKHVWATFLAADERDLSKNVRGQGRLKLVYENPDNLYPLDTSTFGFQRAARDSPPLAVRHDRSGPNRARSGVSDWQRQFGAVEHHLSRVHEPRAEIVEAIGGKRREIWYVLSVSESHRTGDLQIEFFHRATKRNGQFGKLKTLCVDEDEIDKMPRRHDRDLLRLLLLSDRGFDDRSLAGRFHSDYGYSPKRATVLVSPAMYEVVLPRLSTSQCFFWSLDCSQPVEEQGHQLTWDDGPAWKLRLKVRPDDDQQLWRITGEIYRGESTVALNEPVLLMARGVVLFTDRLARLDAESQFAWISLLRDVQTITVPYRNRDELLRRLWRLPSLPAIDLPENLRLKQEIEHPRGHLLVHPETGNRRSNKLYADVSFLYGDCTISVLSDKTSILDLQRGRALQRDFQQEQKILAQLSPMGVQSCNSKSSHGPQGNVEFPKRALPRVVDQLIKEGWIVEAEGYRVRRAGVCRLSVTSRVDWFELDGEFDFEGVSAKLPDLLSALRRGEKYVQLDDGSQGILPQEWLHQYGPLANLAQATGDTLRFAPSQVALLDALLAAQSTEVQVDSRFDDFRAKLRSFDGIRPGTEPTTFRGQLRSYQREGLGWLCFLQQFRFGGCLADDMGLGKTVQVLALLESRRPPLDAKKATHTPSLVVVPRSLVFNWIDEASRFTPQLRVLNYTGTSRTEKLEQLDRYDLLVTTYGTLRRDIARLKNIRFDYAILDESQAIKNPQSQAAKSCRLINAEHRLAMSGTPIENHLGELWSLFEFLNPGMLGRSAEFRRLHRQVSDNRDATRPATAAADLNGNGRPFAGHDANRDQTSPMGLLASALRPFILRRTKKQVLSELPEKTEQTLHCEMGSKQRELYVQLREYYRASLTQRVAKSGIAKSKIHVLEALLRLRQAACHPGLLDKDKIDEPSAKLDTLLEQVSEIVDEGHKALVFSQFTSLLAIVRRQLDRRKIRYEYLDGRTRKRKEKVDHFQEDAACPLFLISLKAGGHGLNLTAADYVFILDPWWNPAVEAQAVDRAHRIGQTRRVFAYRLICRDTVEQKILELQQSKKELTDAIITADNSLIRNLTADDLQLLLS